jgi:uncharacterized protein YkwD
MRRLIFALAITGCGQMYRQPGATSAGSQPPTTPPQTSPAAWTAAPAPAEPSAEAPASATAAPPAARPQSATTIAQRFVDAHNRVRAKHCAPPLAWSAELAAVAQTWANTLRDKGCRFGHSGGTFGENLAAGTEGVLDPEATVKMWYDEIEKYRFPDGGFSMQTGHFTQVVWRGTTRVGCGHVTCKGNDIWVCNYDPAGNWDGQYADNVRPAGCKP